MEVREWGWDEGACAMSESFLEELFAPYPQDEGLLCEMRPLRPLRDQTPPPAPRFFGLTHLHKASEYGRSLAGNHDVYMGVLPRCQRALPGRGGEDGHVRCAGWLWADIDRKEQSDEEMKALLGEVKEIAAPRMAVESGSGLHLYWRLSAVVILDTQEARADFCAILRRLATAVGGDLSCANLSRILRLPGTANHKHDPPARVRWALCDGPDIDIDELAMRLPFEKRKVRNPLTPIPAPAGWNRDSIPEGLIGWAQAGYPEGNRHLDLAGAAAFLRRDTQLPEPVARSLFVEKAAKSIGRREITERELDRIWEWAG